MSDAVMVALIASVPGTLTGMAALVVSVKTHAAVEEVHRATNSMKDALVQAEKKVSFTEGVESEKTKHD